MRLEVSGCGAVSRQRGAYHRQAGAGIAASRRFITMTRRLSSLNPPPLRAQGRLSSRPCSFFVAPRLCHREWTPWSHRSARWIAWTGTGGGGFAAGSVLPSTPSTTCRCIGGRQIQVATSAALVRSRRLPGGPHDGSVPAQCSNRWSGLLCGMRRTGSATRAGAAACTAGDHACRRRKGRPGIDGRTRRR